MDYQRQASISARVRWPACDSEWTITMSTFDISDLRISSAVQHLLVPLPEGDPGDIGGMVYGQRPQAWQTSQAAEPLVW